MKFSKNWLLEWVDPEANIPELSEKLTMSGLEVESVTPLGTGLEHVVVGKIMSAAPHPNADKLQVCQVSVGDDTDPLTIVCGAANARSSLKVAVALIGAVLPGDFKIKQAKIRGVDSSGMLCSTQELGLGESTGGILELAEDAPVGKPFADYLGLPDHIFDVFITPNRGDCLSILGMAREIAAICEIPLTHPNISAVPAIIKNTVPIQVTAEGCPRYAGRLLKNINPNAKTPFWMTERLRRSGLRSIHPIVDITNYVMLELGQPLHAFDFSTIENEIHVRWSQPKEKVTLLDGQTLTLEQPALVIADSQKILALAGIMGGASSAVTTSTTEIFLESAFFLANAIQPTLRKFPTLQSDASHRFERGVDFELPLHAMERATELLVEITGAQPGPVIQVTQEQYLPKVAGIALREARIERILGIKIPPHQIELYLKRLGMQLTQQPQGWEVTAPNYRFDLCSEIDLIEEIARIHGYENIPRHTLQLPSTLCSLSEKQLTIERIQTFLVDKGYRETINYSFIDPALSQLITPNHPALALSNPISADMSVMRTSLWPGLLKAVIYNLNRQQSRLRLFEVGVCFNQENSELAQQPRIAGIMTGNLSPEQWGSGPRPVDFFDLKSDVEGLLKLTHDHHFTFKIEPHPALHPGRCAAIYRDDTEFVGFLGELHPEIQQTLDIASPIYLFELALEAIETTILPNYKAVSKYPAIKRDLAFIIQKEVSYSQIKTCIQNFAGTALQNMQIFDIYQGKEIPEGQKSIALRLIFQLISRTLVDQEVDEAVTSVIAGMKNTLKATLRE